MRKCLIVLYALLFLLAGCRDKDKITVKVLEPANMQRFSPGQEVNIKVVVRGKGIMKIGVDCLPLNSPDTNSFSVEEQEFDEPQKGPLVVNTRVVCPVGDLLIAAFAWDGKLPYSALPTMITGWPETGMIGEKP